MCKETDDGNASFVGAYRCPFLASAEDKKVTAVFYNPFRSFHSSESAAF